MNEQEGYSEVARIRRQIDLEVEAVNRIFREPAIVSNHEVIASRMLNLWKYKEQLDEYMPADDSVQIIIDALDHVERKASE